MGTSDQSFHNASAAVIFDLVLTAPPSTERTVLDDPARRAKTIARAAARKASLLSGSLTLPPGLLGWLTVLPEIYSVWKVQAQMISDIAAIYGKRSRLRPEHMVYCLFKHVAAQLLRDVVVRVGERVIVQTISLRLFQTLVQKLGARVTTAVVSKSALRFIPLLGAAGVSAYSYFDTLQVAKTAVNLFENDLVIEMPAAH